MDSLNEGDLLEIRQALERDSLLDALYALERTLEKLGYTRVSRMSQYDIYASSRLNIPEFSGSA